MRKNPENTKLIYQTKIFKFSYEEFIQRQAEVETVINNFIINNKVDTIVSINTNIISSSDVYAITTILYKIKEGYVYNKIGSQLPVRR